MHLSRYRPGTKRAACFITIFNKVITPNLNCGAAVLWTMSRLNSFYWNWFIVKELGWTSHICEVSSQWNSKWYCLLLSSGNSWTVFTLDTSWCSLSSCTFSLKCFWLSFWASDISSSYFDVSKFTFGFSEIILIRSKRTSSNSDSCISGCGPIWRRDTINRNTRFRYFEELLMVRTSTLRCLILLILLPRGSQGCRIISLGRLLRVSGRCWDHEWLSLGWSC